MITAGPVNLQVNTQHLWITEVSPRGEEKITSISLDNHDKIELAGSLLGVVLPDRLSTNPRTLEGLQLIQQHLDTITEALQASNNRTLAALDKLEKGHTS